MVVVFMMMASIESMIVMVMPLKWRCPDVCIMPFNGHDDLLMLDVWRWHSCSCNCGVTSMVLCR